MLTRTLLLLVLFSLVPGLQAAAVPENKAREYSIAELQHSIGRWEVTTEFLKEDGSVAKSVTGTYEFSWIIPDHVATGKSEIREMSLTAGILFYINEKEKTIEMVSVGLDGRLWVMSGQFGSDVRLTPEYPTTGGGKGRMRFTRFNVTPNSFESRMESTEDGGKTWQPRNHQKFQRVTSQES